MATVPNSEYRKRVALAVGVLAEAFSKTITSITITSYEIGLSGLSPEQVQRAAEVALRQCRFMPSPAELREYAGDIRITDRAEVAWIAFERAITRYGAYKTLAFDDITIHAVVRSLGGMEAALDLPSDEFYGFYRSRFLRAYEALGRAEIGGESAQPLLGEFDRLNQTANPQNLVCIATGNPVRHAAAAIEERKTQIPRVEFKKS